MDQKNQTIAFYFILKGISDVSVFQVLVFFLVLLIYLITLGGHLTILLLVFSDSELHTPMYFFLCNLSIVDLSSTTVTLHKFLSMSVTGNDTISFTACMVQMWIFSWLSGNELIILTAMSYDRYVAICNPLHYMVVMNDRVCAALASFCWAFSFLQILPSMVILVGFTCYTSHVIDHFFCDIMPLIDLTCSDTSILQLLIFTEGVLLSTFTPFLLTFVSYVFIISAILRIQSIRGRSKAFNTCSSHLTVVGLHYFSLVCQYLTPIGTFKSSKLLSLFNTAVVPMLNPIVYSLKNKDVKSAIQRKQRLFSARF
ncbi:olfactory receptor 6C1-like [Hyla sarda]|uniref:olfactory receptor 6C1-like n=1 Tax=Hyla sarda TaxID=327740 RepID=UPI0024C2C2BD|nr:olfactory receptor 6C1-like [Hyla sarda]